LTRLIGQYPLSKQEVTLGSRLSPVEFREFYLSVARGRRRGAIASLTLNTLRPASYLYGGLLWTRGLLYHHGLFPIVKLPVPVISVGNITTGGTGKTPLVEFLARFLEERGKKVAILSSGYAATNGKNDESMELRERLPNIPLLLGKDRLANARTAIEEFHPHCLLLDDGFQHWRLARDLDVVVIDSLEPFGSGDLLPAGTLREPLGSLRRAGLFVLSRTNLCTLKELQDVKSHLKDLNASAPIIETVHHPLHLEDTKGNRIETSYLRGRKVFAFCGLGNPASFEKTLRLLGANVVGFKGFPDHHHYTPGEEKSLATAASQQGADVVITTGKDRVKLQGKDWSIPLLSLRIETRITRGQEALTAALRRILPW
jgi:tetraacyldisaccharide 4'-kinase